VSPNRDARQFVQISEIREIGFEEEVYCATEPKNHSLTFDGIVTGNSEQKLDGWNTCILGSINFYHMPIYEHINGNKYPAWRTWLEERVRFGIRFLDNVVEMEYAEDRSPHPEQRRKLKDMTRIGLGFTGMADWFVKNKIVYGSNESIEVMDEVMRIFAETAYRTSIELGKERGSFTEFDPEWFMKSEFVKRLCSITSLKPEEFTHLRHVCCLSIAPTGTLSFVVSAGGSGVEPFFLPYMIRKERATTGDYVEHYIYDNCVINECKRRGIELTKENVDEMISRLSGFLLVISTH
jgi:ribonucleoside-diphosphate reductase alpha chain